jgi:hypothetical protein
LYLYLHRITSSQHTTKATADDYESDGDSVDEEEIRPLTQAELKKKIIKGVRLWGCRQHSPFGKKFSTFTGNSENGKKFHRFDHSSNKLMAKIAI